MAPNVSSAADSFSQEGYCAAGLGLRETWITSSRDRGSFFELGVGLQDDVADSFLRRRVDDGTQQAGGTIASMAADLDA